MVRFTSSSSKSSPGGGALGGILGGAGRRGKKAGAAAGRDSNASSWAGSSDDDEDANNSHEGGPINDDDDSDAIGIGEAKEGEGSHDGDRRLVVDPERADEVEASAAAAAAPASKRNSGTGDNDNNSNSSKGPSTTLLVPGAPFSASKLAEWAQFVPLRLDARERHLLTVLEQTLHVSEYTDHVDVAATNTGYMGGGGGGGGFGGGTMGFGGGLGGGGGRGGRGGGPGAKARRILDGIMEVCHIAVGLATASGLSSAPAPAADSNSSSAEGHDGQEEGGGGKKNHKHNNRKSNGGSNNSADDRDAPYASKNPADNAALFRSLFEVGRRNKVLNPSSMRTTYGKLMYLLQDAQNPSVAKSLGFRLHKPLLLVGPFLKKHGALELLKDPRLECAIQYVADRDDATGHKRDRATLEALVSGKHRVTTELVDAYSAHHHSSSTLRPEDVKRVIESLADAVAYVESNVRPVQSMLRFLQDNFDKSTPQKGYSLALSGTSRSALLPTSNSYYGRYGYGMSAYSPGSNEGPTLSHSHSTQYMFVWQSLSLWCKVMRNMHKLWICADDDLLSTTSTYHLYNTGQGLNRVQNCPKVRAVMSSLLSQTQREAGGPWVGLSVVHLGDRDVPNALVFIDKYTQIPRFLSPIVKFVHDLPDLCSNQVLDTYVSSEFGSPDNLKRTVLADYFKHGFDGSGDDGGSCIDGRLTSSWNWTSRIAKKRYYHAFMLSGFQGFDGDFR